MEKNIILIILDTLRLDGLGIYSNKGRTPFLDMLSKDFNIYHNAIAPSNWTVPSHASIFTGDYPSVHGIHETRNRKNFETFGMMKSVLEEKFTSLMKKNGFNTIGLSANPHIAPKSGFDDDFNLFKYVDPQLKNNEEIEWESEIESGNGIIKSNFTKLIRGDIKGLMNFYKNYNSLRKKRKFFGYPLFKGGNIIGEEIDNISISSPFFLFINLMEMHEPYTVKEFRKLRNSQNLKWLINKECGKEPIYNELQKNYYHASIYADEALRNIILNLKKKKIYDNSYIIITSDHGQSLGENNYYGHGIFLSDELVRVPLLVKLPNNTKHTIKEGYQSLTKIFDFMKLSSSDKINEDVISEKYALSESFGILFDVKKLMTENNNQYIKELEQPRVALYMDNHKIIINRQTRNIEYVTSNIKKEKLDDLLSVINNFYNESEDYKILK